MRAFFCGGRGWTAMRAVLDLTNWWTVMGGFLGISLWQETQTNRWIIFIQFTVTHGKLPNNILPNHLCIACKNGTNWLAGFSTTVWGTVMGEIIPMRRAVQLIRQVMFQIYSNSIMVFMLTSIFLLDKLPLGWRGWPPGISARNG